tara:strand:+ start:233 stop:367 length:135 start_codon:yes stop_codon:yes gene_type:complete
MTRICVDTKLRGFMLVLQNFRRLSEEIDYFFLEKACPGMERKIF